MKNVGAAFEEYTILLLTYHLMCFTDFQPDLSVRHDLGYSFIAIIVAVFIVFYVVKVQSTIRGWYTTCKRNKVTRKAR